MPPDVATGAPKALPAQQRSSAEKLLLCALRFLFTATRKTVTLIIGVVTLAGAFAFWPRVNVEGGDLVDPTDPYSTFFSFKNTSPLPIYDLRTGCSYLLLDYDNGKTLHGNPNVALTTELNRFDRLEGYGARSFQCPPMPSITDGPFLNRLIHVDVAITVKFSSLIKKWRFQRITPLETVIGKDGHMHWIALSLETAKRVAEDGKFPWPKKEVVLKMSGKDIVGRE